MLLITLTPATRRSAVNDDFYHY